MTDASFRAALDAYIRRRYAATIAYYGDLPEHLWAKARADYGGYVRGELEAGRALG